MTTPLNSINPEEITPTSSDQGMLDILEQLSKPEVQKSLTTLIEQLPKLTELLTVVNKTYDFAHSIATDDVLKNDTVDFIKEIATPVKDTAKNMAATAIEVKERAAESQEVIGLFGLMKMIKDPQAQKAFRYANAFLQVSAEHDSKK